MFRCSCWVDITRPGQRPRSRSTSCDTPPRPQCCRPRSPGDWCPTRRCTAATTAAAGENPRKSRNRHTGNGCGTDSELTNCKFILIRQDPPFNLEYISTTYILETIKNKVKIINDPTSIRKKLAEISLTENLKIGKFKELFSE